VASISPFQGEDTGSIPVTRSPSRPCKARGGRGELYEYIFKMHTVYVLKSLNDGRTYVGCTKDLKNRLKEHNTGEVKSTKARIPFIVWYKEEFVDKYEAFKREKHFKTAWGRRQLRKILSSF
jgi:putative endonuclease